MDRSRDARPRYAALSRRRRERPKILRGVKGGKELTGDHQLQGDMTDRFGAPALEMPRRHLEPRDNALEGDRITLGGVPSVGNHEVGPLQLRPKPLEVKSFGARGAHCTIEKDGAMVRSGERKASDAIIAD